jgi:alkaline phosphatase
MYEEIAADFLKTDIDVFIGGGLSHFIARKDKRNLLNELKEKGYTVDNELKNVNKVKSGKLAVLTAQVHNGRVDERGDMLPIATKKAIDVLANNGKEKGFFVMIEGSQIDWGGHANSSIYIVEDMLDFDRAVGEAIKFAA